MRFQLFCSSNSTTSLLLAVVCCETKYCLQDSTKPQACELSVKKQKLANHGTVPNRQIELPVSFLFIFARKKKTYLEDKRR